MAIPRDKPKAKQGPKTSTKKPTAKPGSVSFFAPGKGAPALNSPSYKPGPKPKPKPSKPARRGPAVEVVQPSKSVSSTATTKTSKGPTYRGQTSQTLGPEVPARKPHAPGNPSTYRGQTSKTLGPKVPKPSKPAAKPSKISNLTAAVKNTTAKASNSIKATASKGINPNLPPGAPGGPKKSAALLATEKKMRDRANLEAQQKRLKGYYDKASDSVKAELAPALNDIQRQMDELTSRTEKAKSETATRGKRAKANIGELYGRLNNYNEELTTSSNKVSQDTMAGLDAMYDKSLAETSKNFDAGKADVQSEAARLGMTSAVSGKNAGETLSSFDRDASFIKGLTEFDRTNNKGQLTRQNSAFNDYMTQMRDSHTATGAAAITNVERDTERTIADLVAEMQYGMTDLSGKRGDIEQSVGQRIRELAEALQDKDYARGMEERQVAFQEEMARKNYNLDMEQFRASQAPVGLSASEELDLYLKELEAAKRTAELNGTLPGSGFSGGGSATTPAIPNTGKAPSYGSDPRVGARTDPRKKAPLNKAYF